MHLNNWKPQRWRCFSHLKLQELLQASQLLWWGERNWTEEEMLEEEGRSSLVYFFVLFSTFWLCRTSTMTILCLLCQPKEEKKCRASFRLQLDDRTVRIGTNQWKQPPPPTPQKKIQSHSKRWIKSKLLFLNARAGTVLCAFFPHCLYYSCGVFFHHYQIIYCWLKMHFHCLSCVHDNNPSICDLWWRCRRNSRSHRLFLLCDHCCLSPSNFLYRKLHRTQIWCTLNHWSHTHDSFLVLFKHCFILV